MSVKQFARLVMLDFLYGRCGRRWNYCVLPSGLYQHTMALVQYTLLSGKKKKKGKKNIYTMFNISKYFQVLSKTLKVI